VRVLPRDALNTDPPASLNQKPYNQVLHLMGESTYTCMHIYMHTYLSVG